MRVTCGRDVKKFSFPSRITELWSRLEEEVVCARSIHDFLKKLYRSEYGDRTA